MEETEKTLEEKQLDSSDLEQINGGIGDLSGELPDAEAYFRSMQTIRTELDF